MDLRAHSLDRDTNPMLGQINQYIIAHIMLAIVLWLDLDWLSSFCCQYYNHDFHTLCFARAWCNPLSPTTFPRNLYWTLVSSNLYFFALFSITFSAPVLDISIYIILHRNPFAQKDPIFIFSFKKHSFLQVAIAKWQIRRGALPGHDINTLCPKRSMNMAR